MDELAGRCFAKSEMPRTYQPMRKQSKAAVTAVAGAERLSSSSNSCGSSVFDFDDNPPKNPALVRHEHLTPELPKFRNRTDLN